MLLKRGIRINSAITWLNWLSQWAVRAVVDGKISAFQLPAGKSWNKKVTNFNLIRLHFEKKNFLEMLIHTPSEYFPV